MQKKHTIQLLASLALVAALVVVYLVPMAFAQDDMTHVPADAFASLERPQVPFAHDAHNEKAELDDCVICHHSMTDDGKRDMEYSSEGDPCSSCHDITRDDGGTPLMRAYHKQCITCHEEKAKGPVACGECHVK